MEKGNHSQLDLGTPVRTFSISTEIAKSKLVSFPRFLIEDSEGGRLGSIVAGNFNSVAGKGGKCLVFDTKYYQENYSATVRLKLESPLLIEIFSTQGDNLNFAKRLEDYLLLTLQFFEETVRRDTIYMTFIPGAEATSRLLPKRNIIERLFSGNMLNLILLFIVIGFILIFLLERILGMLTPIVLLILLLSIMLSAGKIMALRSRWRLTREHPEVAIIEYHLDSLNVSTFLTQYSTLLPAIKKQIYELMTHERRRIGSSEIAKIFSSFGISASSEQIVVKRINVHEIINRAADRFEMPMPTVAVTRNPMPNAAATGFSKHLATMLITIGLLVQLDEKELELVAGHELSHLRSGDPAILFSIFGAEYLARVYIFWPYIIGFGFLYIIFIFYMIFFLGKLLESRADLEAALILRDPKTMATSLKKIGFRRLSLDSRFIEGRETSFGDWMAFDPHPPIGFRIRRLESLDPAKMPKHTFLRSVSDVFNGIKKAIRS